MNFASANAAISRESLPMTIGDYVFTDYVTSGGSSEIYIVESKKFQQVYVGKVINVNQRNMEQQWKSFNSETNALMHLNNPNIIRMYDHFRVGTQFFVILEYCAHGSLSDKIPVNRGLTIIQFREIASQIVSALAFCHSKNIAHRDIKASNVLFDQYGRAKLSDFGLSLHAPYNLLQHSFCGSLLYTAPEVIQRKPNNPFYTDVWSLGVLFCVMLQGKSPWTANDRDGMIQQILRAEYRIPQDVPQEVQDLIAKMLVVDPDKRIKITEILNSEFLYPKGDKGILINTKSLYAKHGRPFHITFNASTNQHSNNSKMSLASSSFMTHSGINLLLSPNKQQNKKSTDNRKTFLDLFQE